MEDAAIYARQYFSQAAQLGHTEGRIHYIRTLIEGVGGDKAFDQAEAEIDALVTAQKEDGSISLLSTIGELYIELGDVEKACAWFEGLTPPELDVIKFEYARFLLTHKHDEVTYQQVFTWLNEWVLDWDLGALELLGQMYEKGLGRPRDKSTASMYYQLAAHYYYPDAIQSERRIASVMSQADKQITADVLVEYRTKHPITPEQQELLDYTSASYLLAREGVTQAETEECIRIFTKYLEEGFGAGLDELIDILYKQKRDSECALWLDVRRFLCVKSMSLFSPCYQKSQQWREIFGRLDNEEIKAIHGQSKRIAEKVDKNLMGRFNNLFFDALEQADKDKEQNKEVKQ
ncbi:conserved domain protein [Photobacterium aphoticum]|uniref:Conserved domain protein n=1 Tax=Photobacterium aphoticum TaxID=754436 RepID=A0A090QQG5_9GAMM|nr:conserved domain protein [Photobacterium aphoticum]